VIIEVSPRVLKIQQMRSFVAVYQEHSFTSAAKRLRATQSGLSMQIKELEDHLGVELLTRTSAGVHPTPAGERFYQRAVSILHDLSDAEEDMRKMQGQLSGSAVVGLMPTFSRAVLPPVLKDFKDEHPLVDVQVFEAYSGVLTKAVIAGEADFAIVPPDGTIEGISMKHVATDREVLVTRSDTNLGHLDPICLKDIDPIKLILPRSGNSRRTRLDAYLNRIGAKVDSIIEIDGMMGTLDMIAQSDWMAILPGALCVPDLDGALRKLHPLVDPVLTVDYVLIQSDVRVLNPAADAIAETFVRQVQKICGEVEQRF